ncbi:hypothetical protein BDV3_001255 [Batrachochytrium dendrobatidis]
MADLHGNADQDNDPLHRKPSLLDDDDWVDAADHISYSQDEPQTLVAAIDFYGILNVDRKATDDDIKSSYKRLCITFHPDKYMDSKEKMAAQRKFQSVQRAYDVLSDPNKRHIYNLYGEVAVDQSWELGPKLKTPEEIEQEFVRQARIKQTLETMRLAQSRGEIVLTLDATSYFQSLQLDKQRFRGSHLGLSVAETRSFRDLLVLPEVQQATVSHEWETQLSSQTDLVLSGKAHAHNGVGNGSIRAVVRHAISSQLQGEVSVNLSQHSSVELKAVRTFFSNVSVTAHGVFNSVYSPPNLTIDIGRKIAPNYTGFITYRPGLFRLGSWGLSDPQLLGHSSSTIGIVHNDQRKSWTCLVHAGIMESNVLLSYTLPIVGHIRARMDFSASSSGDMAIDISGARRIDRNTRVSMGVNCSIQRGVFLKFRVVRLGQKFSIPIYLSPSLNLKLAFFAFSVPLLSGLAFDRLVLNSWRKQRRSAAIQLICQQNESILRERHLDALQATELMRESVARRVEMEESHNGLVIIQALYGKLPPSEHSKASILSSHGIKDLTASIRKQISFVLSADEAIVAQQPLLEYIDVTIPVQALVQNSQLHISAGYAKHNIIGFWDPCLGKKKRLRITYQFQGRVHQVEVDDKAAVAGPLRGTLYLDAVLPLLPKF